MSICVSHRDAMYVISGHMLNLIYFKIIVQCALFLTSIYCACTYLKRYSKNVVHLSGECKRYLK